WRGKGCEECNHTGYLGRIALFELLVADDEVRNMITERSAAHRIKTCMKRSLRTDGLEKAASGVTTLEEVLRVTQMEHADI
ncbi:MAG: type II secretion system protein GspE, partial [Dehalococcoidia bacterium]